MAPKHTNPPRTLEGKVAIVTGASRGIGETIAFDLACRGAKVAITYSSNGSREGAEALVKQIATEAKSEAIAIQADGRAVEAAATIVSATTKAFGPRIDILVNNAGALLIKMVAEMTADDYSHVFDLNVRGALLMTVAALPHMGKAGRIINISSIASRMGTPTNSLYAASKGALDALTRSWAAEFGSQGITVNSVNPGPVKTKMVEDVNSEGLDAWLAMTPIDQRYGEAQEVANVVSFIAEERAGWVTGQSISTSGGLCMW